MWRAKLQRMMDELPDKYLKPQPLELQDKAFLPPDAKPVSQFTEEERRLDGVSRQLEDSFVLEADAHDALHQQEIEHSPNACDRFQQEMDRRHNEIIIVVGILLNSLGERLGYGHDYMIDGDDIYIVPELPPMPMAMPFLGDWPQEES